MPLPQPKHPRFKAGLSVLAVLPPDEAASALRERLDALRQAIAHQRTSLASFARSSLNVAQSAKVDLGSLASCSMLEYGPDLADDLVSQRHS